MPRVLAVIVALVVFSACSRVGVAPSADTSITRINETPTALAPSPSLVQPQTIHTATIRGLVSMDRPLAHPLLDAINVSRLGITEPSMHIHVGAETRFYEEHGGQRSALTVEQFLQKGLGRRVQITVVGTIGASSPPVATVSEVVLLGR